MNTRIAPYGIVLAAALALTGCGGGSGTAGTAGTAQGTSSSTTVAATAGPTSSASATATVSAQAYTNDQLASMLTKLKDAKGRALTVVPAAQLDQGLMVARKVLKTAVVTPKACAILATNNAQVPEGSTYAAGASLSAADKTVTTVTVFAVKDAASMAGQMSASKKAASRCSTVTISVAGKKVTSNIKPVNVTTSGDASLGALATATSPTGTKVTTLTVTGVKGNLAATAVKTGTAVTAAASAELVKLVNTILTNG